MATHLSVQLRMNPHITMPGVRSLTRALLLGDQHQHGVLRRLVVHVDQGIRWVGTAHAAEGDAEEGWEEDSMADTTGDDAWPSDPRLQVVFC